MAKVLRILLLILNGLCAVLLLLSTLTQWVSPSQWWLPSLLSYACPYLFLVNLLWVVLWLCFVQKAFLLSAVAILLRMSFIPLFVQVGGSTEWQQDDTAALRIMTFNVHGFKGSDGELSTDTGAARFISLVRSEQPDVLSLEEFYKPHQYALVDSLERMGYVYHHGARGHMWGVVVFSRYPITPISEEGPGKVCTDIVWQGDTLRLISVHLNSYRLTADETHNLSNLNYSDTNVRSIFHKMRETIDQHEREWCEELSPMLADSPHPVIVAGDFNDTPASYLYQQMSKQLNDVFVKQGRGLVATYHAGVQAFRIDHIFCSDTFAVCAYKCIPSDISDHYPVTTVLRWATE